MESTTVRLGKMLQETPNLCEVKTLEEIGARLGVSRERVRQLLPAPPANRNLIRMQNRIANQSRILAAYVESHPLTLLSVALGGPAMTTVSIDTGIPYKQLCQLWKISGYPAKSMTHAKFVFTTAEYARWLWRNSSPEAKAKHKASTLAWRRANPEKYRAIAKKAQNAWYQRKKQKKLSEKSAQTRLTTAARA